MREAASRGFWLTNRAPYGYRRVYVQDGAKKRPRLDLNPPADGVVQRMFSMAASGTSLLDIAKALSGEGIAPPGAKRWGRTSVHHILRNEAYTGTLIWGINAKDGAPPVRVEDAFPAIVTREQYAHVGQMLRAKAPTVVHPRRAASSHLLSGLVRCQGCGMALTVKGAKSGQYHYYVCVALNQRGGGACEAPRLNCKDFERLIIDQIREHILTESNIRELVRLVDEEMDGVAHEQRQSLKAIEKELADVRRRTDRLWHVVETSEVEVNDILPRLRQHQDHRERLERAADKARTLLEERRTMLDSLDTVTAYVREMSDWLRTSDLAASKAFIRSFVKEIVVKPRVATIRYTVPTPRDSPIGGGDAAEVGPGDPVLSTVQLQFRLVEARGLEPLTSALRTPRSPN